MPDYQKEAAYMNQTDGARAKLLDGTSDGADEPKKDAPTKKENVVEEQLDEKHEMDEVDKRWSQIHDAVWAAQEACKKMKEHGMAADEAFEKAAKDLTPVIEKVVEGDAEDMFGKMEEDAKSSRIPTT